MKLIVFLSAILLAGTAFAQNKRVEIIKEYDDAGNLIRIDSNVTERWSSDPGSFHMDVDSMFKDFGSMMELSEGFMEGFMGGLSQGFDRMDSIMKFEFPDMQKDLQLGFDEFQKEFDAFFKGDGMQQMEELMKESQSMLKNLLNNDFFKELEQMQQDSGKSSKEKAKEESNGKKTKIDQKKSSQDSKVEYY